MNKQQFSSQSLKIDRAEKLLNEMIQELNKNPPYSYILETNIYTNERATFAKKNIITLENLVIICGEIFHNLRSAIDQAYYSRVSSCVPENQQKSIQFPFAKDKIQLENVIKSRKAECVNQEFVTAIKNLKPYSQNGNLYLSLLHEVNIIDKHKFPIPTGNYSKINTSFLQKSIPDFPNGFVDVVIGNCAKDVVWRSTSYKLDDIGSQVPPTMNIYHKILNLPIEVWINIENPQYNDEIIKTMKAVINETKLVLKVLNT